MRRRVCALVLLFPVGVVAPSLIMGEGVRAQEPIYEADQVKAAFLYHFATYVEWPETSQDDPIVIAVLGSDSVADELARFLRGREIQGRPSRLRRLMTAEDLEDVDVLYIGPAENSRLEAHLERVAGQPVLVVSDAMEGLDLGATVNFQLVDRRVRFEISLPAARAAGLMLSSRLLSAATRVETIGWSPYPYSSARRTVLFAARRRQICSAAGRPLDWPRILFGV